MKNNFQILSVIAWRYFLPPAKSGRRSGIILAVLGVTVGVLAMVVVMSIMNGLQQGYIRTILEVESAHVQVYTKDYLSDDDLDKMKFIFSFYNVETIVPLIKQTTMMRPLWGDYKAIQLIALDPNYMYTDKGFIQSLNIISGELPPYGSIVLGKELAAIHGVDKGSLVTIIVLPEGSQEPYELTLEVSGIFESKYYTFDATLALMNLEHMIDLLGSKKALFYNVKLKNPLQATALVGELQKRGYDTASWQDYNKTFFGALRMEKRLMTFLLQLIFVVTAVNIYQGRRRMMLQKERESLILRTLGLSHQDVIRIFTLQGTFIGILGIINGLILGLLLSYYINPIVQWGTLILNIVLNAFGIQVYALYDSSIFYISEIPVEILGGDLLRITMSAIMITSFAGWIAGRSYHKDRPLEL
ncbi:ABC transporter permease [Entomospira nematocerorum]|uniref:ABC transporter permease n=1 Tax=Entomospira nematocerorum TaxID=2719987 RepID=A0A968GEA6_9SPIO|nr:ABC transporter permease [Entomospira nematocera]NIZ46705.1 ABC transporter permease [Entomospira nematocera]WDI33499.1 ABC transporter permease [Entomospira nematocera]